MTSRTVDIAFSKSESQHGRWLAWAINPTSTGMTGSQYIAFTVHNVSAQYTDGQVIIFARFELPMNGSNVVNHVWQEGGLQDDDTPGSHGMS